MSCGVLVRSSKRGVRPEDKEIKLKDRKNLEGVIRLYISLYFEGRRVPDFVDIHDGRYIDLCIGMNICDAADAAYAAMAKTGRFRQSDLDAPIAEDVRLVIGILRTIRTCCIPQEFSAGILLMHLEILEGVSFSTAT
jgi:hypothetical protein